MPHSHLFRLLLCCFAFPLYSVNAQFPLNKLIGGLTSEYFGFNDGQSVSIAPTSDGGFIIAGSTQSSKINNLTLINNGQFDFLVVKTTADGTIQWTKLIGGNSNDIAYTIIQTKDGGYLLGGTSSSSNSGNISAIGHGDSDFCLVKMNASGLVQWTKLFGGINGEDLRSLKETRDGGFILCGSAGSSKSGDITGTLYGYSDIWVVKVKADGTMEWNKLIGGTESDAGYSVQQTIDGGYIVAGLSKSSSTGDFSNANSGYYDLAIIKLDKLGSVSWGKLYGTAKYEQASEIQQTPDGGYIIAGVTQSPSAPLNSPYVDLNGWIMKIDNSGNKTWEKVLAGTKRDVISGIAQMSDGSIIFSGYSESIDGDIPSTNHGKHDYWAMKTTASGNLIWNKNYGGTGDDYATTIAKDNSGLLVLAGLSTSSANGDVKDKNNGFADLWLLAIDSNGNIVNNSSGLTAYYPFVGNAKDVIGGNDAKVVGAKLGTDRFGKINNAYCFDGTAATYLNLGTSSALKPENGTISLWVSADNFSTNGNGFSYNPLILAKNGNKNDYFEAYSIYLTQDSKFISIGTQPNPLNEKYIVSNQNYAKNQWIQVAITFNQDSLKLFINGKLDKKIYKGFKTIYSTLDSVMVGISDDTQNDRYFNGKIDDIRIYNKVLSENEILALYDSEKVVINVKTDLSLKAKSQNRIVEKEKDGVISFTLKNESATNATNIKVLLKIPYTPPFVVKNSQNCTKGTFDSNMWTIPELAAGDSCVLNVTYQPIQNGVWYVEAEVFSADQEDTDSNVNNGIDTEDDFTRACMSIPIKVETEPFGMQLMIEDSKLDISQWYKNDTVIAGATSGVLQVTSLGRFSYTTKTFKCPTQGCCPFILEKATVAPNCCVPLEYILKK